MNSKPESLSINEIETRFRSNYPAYQYHFVEFITEHLCDCSRAFDGDLQELLVLAIVGQMHLKALIDTQSITSGLPRAKQDQPQISASRIADASGIPRETVRRKLVKLADRGWVRKGPAGAWHIVLGEHGTKARDGLSDLDSRAIARMAGLYARLQGLLR